MKGLDLEESSGDSDARPRACCSPDKLTKPCCNQTSVYLTLFHRANARTTISRLCCTSPIQYWAGFLRKHFLLFVHSQQQPPRSAVEKGRGSRSRNNEAGQLLVSGGVLDCVLTVEGCNCPADSLEVWSFNDHLCIDVELHAKVWLASGKGPTGWWERAASSMCQCI